MSIWKTTLDELVELTFRTCLGNWFEGTATSGGTATLIDTTNRGESDDYFQTLGAWIKIRTTTDDAAPKGDERKITDFVQSTSTITVGNNFSAAPAASDTYAIYSRWSWAEVVSAINLAIDQYAGACLIDKIDTSVQLKSGVFDYSMPSGFLFAYKITQADDSGDFAEALSTESWRIIRGITPPRLHLREDYVTITTNQLIRIEGFGRQPKLIKDTDTCYLNPNLIAFQAGATLLARKVMRSDVDPDEFRTQMLLWQGAADRISGGPPFYSAVRMHFPPDTKRVEA